MLKTILPLVFLLFFAGCAATNGPKSGDECVEELYGSPWSLTMIDNEEVRLKRAPFIRFYEDGRMGGFGGCNSFFGDISVTQTAIEFYNLGSTRKLCPGIDGETERRFFALLKGMKWWQFDEQGDLVIFDDEHRLILKKKR